MRRRAIAAALAASSAWAAPAAGQTDYYNTDAARPVRVEDALPTERHAFELQLAPLRVERERGGVYHWEVAPEIAYGVLPRTHVEVGFPIRLADQGGGGEEGGLAGIEVAALHNLNAETTTFPAFAVAADALLPVGGVAPDRVYPSVKGIATRTFRFARFHANAQYTFGDEPDAGGEAGEASRWMAGLAVDRAFPLRSLLATADVFAEQPLDGGAELAWTAEAGVRYQLSPQLNVDLGVGRRFTGGDEAWFFTFGTARAFALRSLIGR
ncbi:MAG TPA: hypothetical protein VHG91_17235 [Longimicrobium sp.]|nr:hypothetical protein [Longimicrobium sp.]